MKTVITVHKININLLKPYFPTIFLKKRKIFFKKPEDLIKKEDFILTDFLKKTIF